MATVDELQAEIDAARAEVQKAVSLLVNRFGHEADVFAVLTAALSHLPPKREEKPAAAVPDFPPDEVKLPDLPPVDEEAAADNPESEVPPEAPRQYRRRKE